jgi:hypothetical protein
VDGHGPRSPQRLLVRVSDPIRIEVVKVPLLPELAELGKAAVRREHVRRKALLHESALAHLERIERAWIETVVFGLPA